MHRHRFSLEKKIKAVLCFIFIWTFVYANQSWMLYDDSEVAIVEITVDPQSLDWIYRWENRKSDSLHLAKVHFKNALIDEVIDSVGFRLRGNTSRDSQKKSFKLSFNTFVPGRQFYDVDKINLNGEHNDPSIIRSKLCWDLYRDIGMTASRAAHAAVYINNEYYGLYISVEHIDDEFLENHFEDADGNLWKCLYPADLTYRGPDPEDYHPWVDAERPYELKTNKEAYDYSALVRLIDKINHLPDEAFADSLESIIVVHEVLKYLAMNVLTGSWDDYWALMNNYYLYYEPSGDIFHFIPYDYDNTFGINWFDTDWVSVNPYVFGRVADGDRPLADRIMENPRLRNLYTHFLNFYRERVYLLRHWESRLDSLKEMITPWAEQDDYRTLDYGFTMDDFHNSYSIDGYDYLHVRKGIKEFVDLRCQYLLGQLEWDKDALPSVYAIDYTPQYPRGGDSITITASAYSYHGLSEVVVQYQPEDSGKTNNFKMKYTPVADTKLVDEYDRWRVTLPPLPGGGRGHFSVLARDNAGGELRFPRSGPIALRASDDKNTGLVINEFLAKNDGANPDAAGEYDDWLEIYNGSDKTIEISGMYLTDKASNLTSWRFPANSAIAAGDYLLVWCDDDAGQSGMHSNFKLDADGEFIALTAADGVTIVDSISFGRQRADVSFGRYPDFSANWQSLNPTPGTSNSTTAINASGSPENFRLSAYPNPFNQEITIEYELPVAQNGQIRIYDIKGRLVWEENFVRKNAGMHRWRWPATNRSGRRLSSGIYILQLVTDYFGHTAKLVLIK